MPGGSLNLSGATSVQAGAGVQLVRHPNGDVTVAANPTTASAPAKPTAGANSGPPGVTPTDNLKELGKVAGNGLATVAVSPVVIVGGVAVTIAAALILGIADRTPDQNDQRGCERTLVGRSESIKWAGGWF